MNAVKSGTELDSRVSEDTSPPTVRNSPLALIWVGLIVAAYVVVATLVPFGMNRPIVDEPIFASSAFHYAETGEIVLADLAAPTAIFDTVWGGTFARLFGSSYGTLRLSTLVLFALSAPFMYALCRGLGAPQSASAVGTAAYLFNPLALSLAFSFHTDGHAVALAVMSAALIVSGLKRTNGHLGMLAAGSTLAAVAYLSRQQFVVVVVASLVAWLFSDADRKRRLFGAAAILVPPAITYWLHSRWTESVGEPHIRLLSRQELLTKTWVELLDRGAWTLLLFVTFLGLLVLPLLPVLLPDRGHTRWTLARPWLMGIGAGIAIVGARMIFQEPGLLARRTWVSSSGFGAVDNTLLGSRPPLLGPWPLAVVGVALFTAVFFWLATAVRPSETRTGDSTRIFAFLMIAGFVFAAFVSSLAFHGSVLDRYWLPLLPPAVGLAVARGWSSPRRLAGALILVSVMGIATAIGVRDAFVAYEEITAFADDVTASGIQPDELDAGATWMAQQFGLADLRSQDFGGFDEETPWWIYFYGEGTRPEYAISHVHSRGYQVLDRREYTSLLHTEPTYLYLLRRDPDSAAPP